MHEEDIHMLLLFTGQKKRNDHTLKDTQSMGSFLEATSSARGAGWGGETCRASRDLSQGHAVLQSQPPQVGQPWFAFLQGRVVLPLCPPLLPPRTHGSLLRALGWLRIQSPGGVRGGGYCCGYRSLHSALGEGGGGQGSGRGCILA